jgi:hypothetical protein
MVPPSGGPDYFVVRARAACRKRSPVRHELCFSLARPGIWRNLLAVKKITAVKPLDGFRLWLQFSDGVEGIADLSDLAGHGVFSTWNTPGLFANVKATEYGAVAWGDEIDLCPDTLYLRITGKTPEDLFPALRDTVAHA